MFNADHWCIELIFCPACRDFSGSFNGEFLRFIDTDMSVDLFENSFLSHKNPKFT